MVFEKGTYLTVKELKEQLDTFDDDLPVCRICDGRAPLLGLIPSLNSDDEVALVVLWLASEEDLIEVEM